MAPQIAACVLWQWALGDQHGGRRSLLRGLRADQQRHHQREDGEGGGVTFVKGIRVSESSGRIMHGSEMGESIQTKLLVQTCFQ